MLTDHIIKLRGRLSLLLTSRVAQHVGNLDRKTRQPADVARCCNKQALYFCRQHLEI